MPPCQINKEAFLKEGRSRNKTLTGAIQQPSYLGRVVALEEAVVVGDREGSTQCLGAGAPAHADPSALARVLYRDHPAVTVARGRVGFLSDNARYRGCREKKKEQITIFWKIFRIKNT